MRRTIYLHKSRPYVSRFDRSLRENTSIGRLSKEWFTCTDDDLRESIIRQTKGAQCCLVGLINATNSEYNEYTLSKIFLYVGGGHTALNRFCDLTINLRKKFPHTPLTDTLLYQRINLYAIEILELIYRFNQVNEYFTHQRKLIVIYLRIIYKLRVKLERYLVNVNFWNVWRN